MPSWKHWPCRWHADSRDDEKRRAQVARFFYVCGVGNHGKRKQNGPRYVMGITQGYLLFLRIDGSKVITQVITLTSTTEPMMKPLMSFFHQHSKAMPAVWSVTIILVEASIALYILRHL